ncbi:50S ribosomal protein L32 [Candidatus Parcubacteria bacterium]|nr:MAG: 50S ribosomal protein L32 [Candidatus Parcubacteria bacterium]
MSVPAFKNSKSKVRRRRSHHALSKTAVAQCQKCGEPILPHRICPSCGFYKGRQVKGKMEKAVKALEKKTAKADQ